MSVEPSPAVDNVVPLRPIGDTGDDERARTAAGQVRRQLRLLQGYADLMDGLSPQQNVRILKVMAEKIDELTQTLRPFVEDGIAKRKLTLEDYREARSRNDELMAEYRAILKRLRTSVETAHSSLSAPVRLDLA